MMAQTAPLYLEDLAVGQTFRSGTVTVDCSPGKLPAIVVGPHQTVDLVGTLWARTGFVATGTPLKAGVYALDLGDRYGSVPTQFVPHASPNLTVTP